MIYGKVASFWLLFSWLMLFPGPGASVRTERQPTDAEILAAFPHGAVEIAPNAGVDAVLAHHRSGHPHPHELLHLAEHHDKKSECGSDSPVLDAGDVGMTGELSDLYGNSRLVGAGVDIGAVERQ